MSIEGRFVWYELMTTDPEGAKAFYPLVTPWKPQQWEGPFDYAMWVGEQGPVGGVMALPDEASAMGAPPHWMGYVAVTDVDATADQAKSLGGQILVPPTDIPGVGRFSIIADPTGAAIAAFKGVGEEMKPDPRAPGSITWHELYTTDLDAAFGFYAALFGWTKTEAMDMGPEMGLYQMYAAPDGTSLGGMMKRPAGMPASAWCYYVRVADVDEAATAIKAAGGQVVNGPMDVPGGDRIVQGVDPQGAFFALSSGPA